MFACSLELVDGDVTEADLVDEALVFQFGERRDGVLEGVGVGAVELIEVDGLGSEPVAGGEHLIADVIGVAVGEPLALAVAQEAGFRRHDDVLGSPIASPMSRSLTPGP